MTIKAFAAEFRNARKIDVVQFGTARSGSTLCYNAIKTIWPDAAIHKTHSLNFSYWGRPIIATTRDPFDSVVSMVERMGAPTTDENVKKQADALYSQGFSTLRRHAFFPRLLLLRYEDFIDDLGSLLDTIGSALGRRVTPRMRDDFINKFDVRRLRAEVQGRSFSEWDPDTLLHGSHISERLGAPGGRELLSRAQRGLVSRALRLPRPSNLSRDQSQ